MPYLGNVPAEAYTNTVKDSFNGDASTTAFTLSQPSTTNNLRVVVENVIQDPTVAYTVSGTTLTFTSAPPVGTANIYAVHLGPAVQTAVPPSEINNATTYTSDLTVQGAFTSQGIDDNATSTAMTLDSSGNMLVGRTSNNWTTVAGFTAQSNGAIIASRADASGYFNRISTDGDIAQFLKDGTTVGSISVAGGNNLQIASTAADHAGLGFGTHVVAPLEANADSDGTINLGASNARFQDLYLSGGVYLGGTGSANYLDDYEEGTWTPRLRGVTTEPGSLLTGTGRYVKIGDFVSAYFSFENQNTTGYAGGVQVDQLPFTIAAQRLVTGSIGSYNAVTWTNNLIAELPASSTLCSFMDIRSGTSWTSANHSTGTVRYIWGTFSYRVS